MYNTWPDGVSHSVSSPEYSPEGSLQQNRISSTRSIGSDDSHPESLSRNRVSSARGVASTLRRQGSSARSHLSVDTPSVPIGKQYTIPAPTPKNIDSIRKYYGYTAPSMQHIPRESLSAKEAAEITNPPIVRNAVRSPVPNSRAYTVTASGARPNYSPPSSYQEYPTSPTLPRKPRVGSASSPNIIDLESPITTPATVDSNDASEEEDERSQLETNPCLKMCPNCPIVKCKKMMGRNKLRVCIILVGSEGDIRPYIPFANALRQEEFHEVRLVTHERHRNLVEKSGLEFHSIDVDPKDLMSFLVRHPDMITYDIGEAKTQFARMKTIFRDSMTACTTPGYRPDVLIANPPLNVHVDIAEKCNCALQLIFPFPFGYTPTSYIKHPFTYTGQHKSSNERESYDKMESLMRINFLGIGMPSVINQVRAEWRLPNRIDQIHFVAKLKVPHLYTMSEHLVERPPDWGPHIGVSGFFFVDDPFPGPNECIELRAFIARAKSLGAPLCYFGYGSVPVPDPAAFVGVILKACQALGAHCILQTGWSDMGDLKTPETVFILPRANHLWLFAQCDVVSHHGGIGTLATGLRVGTPTIITPFFGDQFLWAEAIVFKGYGTSIKATKEKFTPHKLLKKLRFCLQPWVKERVMQVGREITREWEENKVSRAVEFFYANLPLDVNGDWVEEVWENQMLSKNGADGWHKIKKLKYGHAYSDLSGLISKPDPQYGQKNYLPPDWEWKSKEWQLVQRQDTSGWLYLTKDDTDYVPIANLQYLNNKGQCLRRRQWVRTRTWIGSLRGAPRCAPFGANTVYPYGSYPRKEGSPTDF